MNKAAFFFKKKQAIQHRKFSPELLIQLTCYFNSNQTSICSLILLFLCVKIGLRNNPCYIFIKSHYFVIRLKWNGVSPPPSQHLKGKAINVIEFNAKGFKLLTGQLTIEASYTVATKTVIVLLLFLFFFFSNS